MLFWDFVFLNTRFQFVWDSPFSIDLDFLLGFKCSARFCKICICLLHSIIAYSMR